jgi:beta-glucosidase
MSITNNVKPATGVDTSIPTAFPADFLWGAATASYQIEGAAYQDGRGLSIWDQFAATPGKVFQGDNGDIAADHYRRMPEDVALMARLGLNAYRFSIAWPRILPQGTGTVNSRGLDFYDRLVDALLARGITPLVTLYHWDLPLALHEKGGWLNRDTAFAFSDYAEVVARRLGDRVDWWTTLNEPWCSAYLGYGIGVHAPGIHDMQSAYIAAHHLLLAHGLALPRLRALTRQQAQLGITLNLTPVYAANDHPETFRAVELADKTSNRWFLDPIFRGTYPEGLFTDTGVDAQPVQDGDLAIISTPIDLLGINNYSRSLIRARMDGNGAGDSTSKDYEHVAAAESSYTDMGWEVYPQALRDVLVRVHRDYAPRAVAVTENGAAFADQWDGSDHVRDPQRVHYIREHIRTLAQALAQGVPLRGYFVWSLLDNFEWAEGYSKRFGIVYIDYPTQRRIVKDSGRWYADFIASQRRQKAS